VLDGTSRQARDQKTVFKATGNASTLYYDVTTSARPVKVTLAWTDPPGPTVGNSFVNDLNLEVTAGGTTYKGNVFSGGHSVAGGSSDPRNNLENVILPAGVSGKIKVRVLAGNIAGDGVPGNADTTDQDYALLVSNAGPESTTGAVLTAGTRTVTPGGDGDAYVEPGELFSVTQQLRNVGNATATGISGNLTGAGVTVNTGSATWPNLASNGAATNTPAFRATVSPSQGCGVPVSLTIKTNSSSGPGSIPFTVPIGRPSANTITRTSTDVPKAIPDSNPTGVTSTLVANSTGSRVYDLNVRIGQITHTFDSDLVITITSPAATTVTLASRNGSSGDNFTSTVFDDEAATAITSGSAPFTGSFRPVQSLSAFDGQAIAGTWTLRVSDVAAEDTGTLSDWSTLTRGYAC
jgi:subtilisin-like proprotein convertase family protein